MNYKNLTVPDSLSPSVRSISISPLDEYSRIGRSHHQIVVRPFGQKHHMYNVPRKIFVQGKIGLGINARDGISGTYHPVGIYRLESYLDDSLIFATRFDRLLADGSKQILMYYDFPLMRMGRGRFQKLYVDQEPTLPMYDHLSGTAGIIDADKLDEGTHRFRIVVKDVHDNAAEVHGLLVSEHQTAIDSVRTKGKPEKRVQKNLAETPYDSLTIHPEMHGWFTFDNNMFEIVYDSGSVFQPLALHVEKEQGNKTTIYRVEPHDVVLNKGIRLFVRPHGTFRGPVALYGRDRRRWELLPTTFDSSTGYFSTSLTQTLGDIALLEDTHPPVIGAVKIKTSGGKPAIHCRVYDDRSGVDANEIKMYIDDVFVIPEIDGERWRVRYEADHRLSAGWHALRIVAKDKMKNESSLTRTFAVTR